MNPTTPQEVRAMLEAIPADAPELRLIDYGEYPVRSKEDAQLWATIKDTDTFRAHLTSCR